MEKSMERRSGNVEREGSRNITICKEIQRNVQSITDVLAVIHSTRRATSRYLLARAVFIFWTRYASLHAIFIIMTVCARGVVGFSTSLTSTPRCDPIWSSAVRRVWAKAAGIGLTCECAYGQFTNDLLPSSYIFLSQDRHACVMYGRVSCAGRFVPVWFSMRVFLGKRARCSTNSSAVHFRGLVNIYDRVFPLTQARLLGSAGVATHTSHCKALR